MVHEQAAPVIQAASKPYFDEDARLNPMARHQEIREASPFFARLLRQIPWVDDPKYSLRWLVRRSATRILFYLAVLTAFAFLQDYAGDLASGVLTREEIISGLIDASWLAALSVVTFSLLFSLLMDYNILSLRIGRDNEWELLRLSRLSRRGIVVAIFAYWRVGYWRRAASISIMRLVALCLFALTSANYFWLVSNFVWDYFASFPSQMLVLALWFLCFAAILVFEPRWRLNGVCAAATALALNVRDDFATIARIGTLLGLWLGQVAIFAGSGWLAGWLVERYWERWRDPLLSFIVDEWVLVSGGVQYVLMFLFFGIGLFVYFRAIRSVSLRLAYRAMLREDGA